MEKVIRIDGQGLFIEDLPYYDGEITHDIIEALCPEGFYKPKWDGTKWVEGMAQEKIDALNNATTEPTLEDRMLAIEDVILNLL